MPLSVGDKLGQYEILAPLGAGGMGEVYRARDAQLDRDVAIKVLPRVLASDPERLARFDREAKILAAMNHPNIAVIYGLVESDGGRALVMEVIEGETLSSILKRGPLSIKDTCKIARQIAEALEAAHDKGIVHRDLKPGNIMVTPAGLVKVLDFGLAAMAQPDRSASGDPHNSPTLTIGGTVSGTILGTASYMSPEQAEGFPVDKRADIWSYGVVLWEMLTAKRLFEGQSISRTLADVLRMEIDFSKLPPETPAPLRKILERCLDRETKTRLRDIGEARILFDSPMEVPSIEPIEAAATAPHRRSWLPWCVAAFFLLALMPANILHLRETPPPERVLRYTLAPPENSSIHSFAVSPDGRFVAIAAVVDGKRQLWLRPLGALEAQPMPTTEDARYPFWSPDSRFIGFFAEGKLRKIDASGGPSQPVCDAGDARGGSWSREDVIVFSASGSPIGAIQRVPAAGGVPSEVTKTKTRYLFPNFLPDGSHFLYETAGISAEKNGIYLASLDGKENRRLLADASGVVFVPSAPQSRTGHLFFLRESNLMAQPFDTGSLQTTGDVFPVAENVSLANGNNYAPVTGSDNGVLLYWNGGTGGVGGSNQLVWYDRGGKLPEPVDAPGNVLMPSLSPDEKTAAFSRQVNAPTDIWLRDLVRGTDRRFTSDPSQNVTPLWSPKGDRVVFRSDRGGHPGDLYQKAADGSGQDEPLLSTPNNKLVNQWSRDGRFIVYSELDPKTIWDLWVLSMGEGGDRKPTVFLHTEFTEVHGQLSPDNHWMAYTSNVSGQREVYVRTFPAGDNEQRISIAGGDQPRWRADGKELFYIAADGKLMSVAVKETAGPKPGFEAGKPAPLFDSHIAGLNINYFNYDVTADGKRFLVATTGAVSDASTTAVPPLTVMVNWNTELKK